MIRFLSEPIVLAIHADQIRLYGGAYEVRDAQALDAALHMPQKQFEGKFLYHTIFHMAATYGFHLCQSHPFIDGNKRTAGMTMFVFLRLNGLVPIVSELEYYQTMMAVASGTVSKESLIEWVQTAVEGIAPDVE